MHIKKVALHAMVLGMAAVAVMATNQPIDWEAPCTDDAVIVNWVSVRTRLYLSISGGYFGIDYPTRSKVSNLLDGYYLPPFYDLDIFRKVADIVGANFMQLTLGTFLDNYWAAHPCVNPTPTLSSSTSIDSSSTDASSAISSDTSTSDSDSTSSSDSSSSDTHSTEISDSSSTATSSTFSSDSSSSEIYSSESSDSSSTDASSTFISDSSSSDASSSYSTTSVYSSTSIEPTSITTDIYSSAPTFLYSTIPPHKCYVAVVVTSRVVPAYSVVY